MRKQLVPALAAALVVAPAACAAGAQPAAEHARPTQSRVATMLPPAVTFSPSFRPLSVDSHSGPVDNDRAAALGTIDPYDTSDDLERAGRVNGYLLSFVAPTRAAVEQTGGVVELDETLDVFTNASAARRFVEQQRGDLSRYAGIEIESGVQLGRTRFFRVEGLGDEARGSRVEFRFGATVVHTTFVDFRLGRLIAGVGVTRVDDTNIDGTVKRFARMLAERIDGVLRGQITGPRVPLPIDRIRGPDL